MEGRLRVLAARQDQLPDSPALPERREGLSIIEDMAARFQDASYRGGREVHPRPCQFEKRRLCQNMPARPIARLHPWRTRRRKEKCPLQAVAAVQCKAVAWVAALRPARVPNRSWTLPNLGDLDGVFFSLQKSCDGGKR